MYLLSYSSVGDKFNMGLLKLKSRNVGLFLLEALGENLFPCLFQFVEATCVIVVPFSNFKVSSTQ